MAGGTGMSDMGKLDGKVALVTGGGSGIGAASAERFGAEGATVVTLDIAATEHKVDYSVDVRNESDVQAAIASIVAQHGRLDIVLNAAGVAGGGPVHLLPLDEWDRVIGVNLTGTFLVSKHALAPMLEQGSGSIINIASIEGVQGTDGGSAYNASKGGVVLLTKNLAIDYGRAGIRVNCICPGFIDTPMMRAVLDGEGMKKYRDRLVDEHKLGRIGEPAEIAAAATFLASDDASFVTGHIMIVDGGYTAGTRLGVLEGLGL